MCRIFMIWRRFRLSQNIYKITDNLYRVNKKKTVLAIIFNSIVYIFYNAINIYIIIYMYFRQILLEYDALVQILSIIPIVK